MSKKVTMQDIADALGVSKVTISKFFNQSDDISVSMRNKIMKKAEELGYVYNRGKRKKVYVFVSQAFYDPNEDFYTNLFKQLVNHANINGLSLILNVIDYNDIDYDEISDLLVESKDVFLLGQFPKHFVKEVKNYAENLVLIDFEYRRLKLFSVVTNNFQASYDITSLLIDKGYTKIGFVGNIKSTTSIQDRYLGFYKALLENDIVINNEYNILDRNDRNQLIDLVLPENLPQAYVCNNDHIAYLLINEIKRIGLNVPEDIAVVGFDNVIYSQLSTPKITTVTVRKDIIASTAVKMLINLQEKKAGDPFTRVVDNEIIERESVKDLR